MHFNSWKKIKLIELCCDKFLLQIMLFSAFGRSGCVCLFEDGVRKDGWISLVDGRSIQENVWTRINIICKRLCP